MVKHKSCTPRTRAPCQRVLLLTRTGYRTIKCRGKPNSDTVIYKQVERIYHVKLFDKPAKPAGITVRLRAVDISP